MKHIKYILILALTIGFSQLAKADDNPEAPPSVPIDGGASLLLAAGAAYGIKKLAQKRATKMSTNYKVSILL